MIRSIFLKGCVLVFLAGGCAPSFSGEWLEDTTTASTPLSATTAVLGQRRAAMQFDPISSVRTGAYNEDMGVVDEGTVQANQYFTFAGGQKAQFGSVIAKLESNDRMTATAGGGLIRHFIRVHGDSIFPPLVQIPNLITEAKEISAPHYLSAAP